MKRNEKWNEMKNVFKEAQHEEMGQKKKFASDKTDRIFIRKITNLLINLNHS